jgi:hypothetical protein
MPNFLQHTIDGAICSSTAGFAGVGHVQQQIGLPGFFQRRFEAGNQAGAAGRG